MKVQRPGALSTISKDLYVMRRGVGVYEQLVKRFTAQTTDYQRLVSTFAEGLYTEMDFRNEVRRRQVPVHFPGASKRLQCMPTLNRTCAAVPVCIDINAQECVQGCRHIKRGSCTRVQSPTCRRRL